MATFNLESGGGQKLVRQKPTIQPSQVQQPGLATTNRQEDDPYAGNDPAPAAPPPTTPAPATPTPGTPDIPPPTHNPWEAAPAAPTTPTAPTAPSPWAPAPSAGTSTFHDQLNALYQRYAQRDATAGEEQAHAGNPGGLNAIEAALRSSGLTDHGMGGGPQNGDYRGWFTNLFQGKPFTQETLVGMEPLLKQYGIGIEPANSQGERHKLRLPDGSVVRVGFGEGVPVWIQQSGPGGGTNPFDDPATQGYVSQLQAMMQHLQQPRQNPEMDSLLKYLNQYFQQLQNPVYTNAQRDLINTQAIDPMEHQRTARKQQVLQQMASRGMGPSDGPTIQALADVDRQFDQMHTQTQSGFAKNEIDLGRQNQQQAVNVGTSAAQLRDGIFGQDESRMLQALSLGKQIPDMAQQRLAQAIQLLGGNQTNPASLFPSMQSFGQQGINQNTQDSQYWQTVMAAILKAFGG